MRQHEALLYEHSTEVKKQGGVKWQETLIVKDRALKPLTLTCRRISCTRISLKRTKCDFKKLSSEIKRSFFAHLECTAQFHCLAQFLPGSAAEDCEFH
jgi:hypothetical protein